MKETEKMLNIIHENCKQKRAIRQVKEEINKKKDKRTRRIMLIGLATLFVIVIALSCVYRERQIKTCMANGGTEKFCRYAGE